MYTYETFPGQTIVRGGRKSGFTDEQLIHELSVNGDGMIVLDENHDPADKFLLGLEGRDCREFVPARIEETI